jgi:hypothetical protein
MTKGSTITVFLRLLDGPGVASQLLSLPDWPIVFSSAQKKIS